MLESFELFLSSLSEIPILFIIASIFFNCVSGILILPTFWITVLNIGVFGPIGGFILSVAGQV